MDMVPLYTELVMKGKGYVRRLEAIKRSDSDPSERAREADTFCEFCINASQNLMRTASRIEQMAEELPEEKELLKAFAEINREGARKFGEIYRQCQDYQRKGIIPTNLPKF